MMNSNIKSTNSVSFGTKIVFKDIGNFYDARRGCKKTVDHPWSINEITRAPEVFTMAAGVCTAGGVLAKSKTGKHLDIVMFHITPSEKNLLSFQQITDKILEKLDGDSPLQGFLLGSRKMKTNFLNTESDSANLFNKFRRFFTEQLQIPVTLFRGTNEESCVSFAYDGYKDQADVLAFSPSKVHQGPLKEFLSDVFEETKISNPDTVSLQETSVPARFNTLVEVSK